MDFFIDDTSCEGQPFSLRSAWQKQENMWKMLGTRVHKRSCAISFSWKRNTAKIRFEVLANNTTLWNRVHSARPTPLQVSIDLNNKILTSNIQWDSCSREMLNFKFEGVNNLMGLSMLFKTRWGYVFMLHENVTALIYYQLLFNYFLKFIYYS